MRLNLLLLLLLFISAVVPARERSPGPLAFTHVTVIDATGAPPRPDMTVVVSGNRIVALGRANQIRVPVNARTIEGSGKYLIPGLWDMHFHSGSFEEATHHLSRLLALGITGVRDMGTPLHDVLRLRRETAEGRLLRPRMVVCGPLLEGPLPFYLPLLLSVTDPAEARTAVSSLKQQGVDFIKVHDFLSRETYYAIAAEARREHLPFAGHVPIAVS